MNKKEKKKKKIVMKIRSSRSGKPRHVSAKEVVGACIGRVTRTVCLVCLRRAWLPLAAWC